MAPSLPIGEIDANIFACPACSRPLDSGTRRCPGCATRLIAGRQGHSGRGLRRRRRSRRHRARRRARRGHDSCPGHPARRGRRRSRPRRSSRPSQAPIASRACAGRRPGHPQQRPVGAPPDRRSSISASLDDAARLTAALATAKPSSSEIAPILRSMASTAMFGQRLAPTVGGWAQAEKVSADLRRVLRRHRRDGRSGTVVVAVERPAYVAAGERMLTFVAGLDALDAASRTLAAAADLDLPPLTPDAVARAATGLPTALGA